MPLEPRPDLMTLRELQHHLTQLLQSGVASDTPVGWLDDYAIDENGATVGTPSVATGVILFESRSGQRKVFLV